jgi:hypothetical protein
MHIVAMKQTRDSGGPGADAISQNYQVDVSLGLAIPMVDSMKYERNCWEAEGRRRPAAQRQDVQPQYVHWLVNLLEGIQDS